MKSVENMIIIAAPLRCGWLQNMVRICKSSFCGKDFQGCRKIRWRLHAEFIWRNSFADDNMEPHILDKMQGITFIED